MNTLNRAALAALINYCSDDDERDHFTRLADEGELQPLPNTRIPVLGSPEDRARAVHPESHPFAAAIHMADWQKQNPMVFDTHDCKCPRCGSDMVEGDGVTIDGATAVQVCTCTECGKVWSEHYQRVRQDDHPD